MPYLPWPATLLFTEISIVLEGIHVVTNGLNN